MWTRVCAARPATNTLIALAEQSVESTNAHANQDIMEAGTQEDAIVCINFIFVETFSLLFKCGSHYFVAVTGVVMVVRVLGNEWLKRSMRPKNLKVNLRPGGRVLSIFC